jgi:hypothetical protein
MDRLRILTGGVAMQRREVLVLGFGAGIGVAASLIGCGADAGPADPADVDAGRNDDTDAPPADASASGPDACVAPTVLMHDTHAQALYLDGSKGPLTGIIRVADVVAGTTLALDFWHGHGGVPHRFTLEPVHFEMLVQGHEVTLGTTMVDGHAHTLFVDPVDEAYRVAGAPDVPVSLGC